MGLEIAPGAEAENLDIIEDVGNIWWVLTFGCWCLLEPARLPGRGGAELPPNVTRLVYTATGAAMLCTHT